MYNLGIFCLPVSHCYLASHGKAKNSNARNLPIEEPIDLLNVAFDNPRKAQAQSPSATKKKKKKPPIVQAQAPSFNVPDRLTGLQEVEELRRLCPGRTWNFVSANLQPAIHGAHKCIGCRWRSTYRMKSVNSSTPEKNKS